MSQLLRLLHGHDFVKAVYIGAAHGVHALRRAFLQRAAHAQIAIGVMKDRFLQGCVERTE